MEPVQYMNSDNKQDSEMPLRNKPPRSGDKGLFRIVLERVYGFVKVVLYNSSGTEIGTVANPVNTTGTITGTVPLPMGAATAALQTAGNASLTSIDGKLSSQATAALQTTGNGLLTDIKANQTNGTQHTIVDSGSITANAGTDLNTSLLAKDTTLTDKSQFAKITDGTDTLDLAGTSDDPTSMKGIPIFGQHPLSSSANVASMLPIWPQNVLSDTLNPTTLRLLQTCAIVQGWSGTRYDRIKSVNTGQLVNTWKNSAGTEPGVQAANAATTTASVVQLVQPVDLHGRTVYYDAVDNATVCIELPHHKIHEGQHFTWSTYDADVDSGAPKYWRITTPNTTTRIHWEAVIATTESGVVQLYENPTINAAGTAGTIYNNERNSATTATATVFEDTTTTSDGTVIDNGVIGSGAGPQSVGGDTRTDAEWVLKQNEDYIVKFTPYNDNAKVTLTMLWYEV